MERRRLLKPLRTCDPEVTSPNESNENSPTVIELDAGGPLQNEKEILLETQPCPYYGIYLPDDDVKNPISGEKSNIGKPDSSSPMSQPHNLQTGILASALLFHVSSIRYSEILSQCLSSSN